MAVYPVAEEFLSINGEGQRAGELAYFIRFPGCNLNCSYCDTKWANGPDAPRTMRTTEELLDHIAASGAANVTLTGGEPLLQEDLGELLEALSQRPRLSVEIETNGSVDLHPFRERVQGIHFTLDYKLPGSGMESRMLLSNYDGLEPGDTVKFVCGSRADLARAEEILFRYDLPGRCGVYFSPVFGAIDPAEMVEYMKEHRLTGVRLQLQLHKFIWDPDKTGV